MKFADTVSALARMQGYARVRRLQGYAAIAVLAGGGCARPASQEWTELTPTSGSAVPTMQFTGTVRFLDPEGGTWVVRSADVDYSPTNLPAAYQKDGMRVEVVVLRMDNMASISMRGPIIEVQRIRLAPNDAEPSLVATKWVLSKLPGSSLSPMEKPTLHFEGATVRGFGGCNQYSGTAVVGPGTLTMGPLASTRKSCGAAAAEIEAQFLRSLQDVVRFEITDGVLKLVAVEGEVVVRMIPANDAAQMTKTL